MMRPCCPAVSSLYFWQKASRLIPVGARSFPTLAGLAFPASSSSFSLRITFFPMVHPPFGAVGALSLTVKGDAASVARGDFFGEGLFRLLFIPIHRASAPTRPSPGFFPQGP